MVVLVVDDELPIREWLQTNIQKAAPPGALVVCASNGREAMDYMRSHPVDIVFTDIKMPVMDGMELLRFIRKEHNGIYAVMLTSYTDFSYVRTALSLRAEAYILKNEISMQEIERILLNYQSEIKAHVEALNQSFYSTDRTSTSSAHCPSDSTVSWEDCLRTLLARLQSWEVQELPGGMELLMKAIQTDAPQGVANMKAQCLALLKKLEQQAHTRYGYASPPSAEAHYVALLDADSFEVFRETFARLFSEIMDAGVFLYRNEYVCSALTFIHQNYASITSITDICRHVNINMEYLCRLFKKETAQTLNAYLITFRMRHARTLLRTTNQSILEIAEIVGYDNVNYFSRLYKKTMHINPKDDRRP